MFDFHEKRKIRNWLYSKPVLVLMLIPIGFLSVSVFERFEKERETAEKRDERQAELDVLNERAAAFEARVDYLKSERGIETEIRDRYDAVKKGEQAVIIVGDTSTIEYDNSLEENEEDKSFFSRLKFW